MKDLGPLLDKLDTAELTPDAVGRAVGGKLKRVKNANPYIRIHELDLEGGSVASIELREPHGKDAVDVRRLIVHVRPEAGIVERDVIAVYGMGVPSGGDPRVPPEGEDVLTYGERPATVSFTFRHSSRILTKVLLCRGEC